MTKDDTLFEGFVLAMGCVTGGLTHPAIFMTFVEDLQDGNVRSDAIVFVRDALTRALQLAGVEPLPPKP